MTLLLTFGSGARILEKSMCKRAGWAEYAERTSMFFPLPPEAGDRSSLVGRDPARWPLGRQP